MVIKLFDRHSVLVCICILAAAVAVTMAVNFGVRRGNDAEPADASVQSETATEGEASASPSGSSAASRTSCSAPASSVSAVPNAEMRAVWVPFMSLNMSREADKSEKAFQKKFDVIVSGAKQYGMNTLVVQVRPFGDALYPSSYFPWSHIVGGTQGVNPGYDPLAYMVSAAHGAGLKLHAWVNPLRIQVSGTPSVLAQQNPYNTWKADSAKADWVVDFDNGKYYNPAYPQVRKLIADGVGEIAKKYDVDGIQFDDYFYPSEDASFDQKAYEAYKASASKNGTPLSLPEWRRANISALVSQVYSTVKAQKKDLPFGISPQANVENNMKIGADVAAWCSARGYVDYLCPQLYVSMDHPVLPFEKAAQEWKAMVKTTGIKLYVGLAVYKAGSDADSGTWKTSTDILARQVETGRKNKYDGFMFYSWDSFNSSQAKEEVQNVMKVLN